MDDFSFLQEEILRFGWEAVLEDIEAIENPYNRAIERADFFEVVKTLPIEIKLISKEFTLVMAEDILSNNLI